MMPWQIIGETVGGLIDLADQAITDKDKLIEFKFKAAELQAQSMQVLISAQTVPWVDATVKLLFALNSLWRPVIGGLMTLFGAYAHYKGLPIDPTAHLVFDGAFPAWGVSRHVEKKEVIKERKKPIFPTYNEDILDG